MTASRGGRSGTAARRRPSPLVVGGLLLTLVACGGAGNDEATPELAATGAWARPTPSGADNGVAYLTLSTDRPDAVVGASVGDDRAAEVQLHRTVGASGGAGHSHGAVADSGDLVSMGEVEELAVAPDEPLVFEPGGSHVMLVDLARPLRAGEQLDLTLEFASARTLSVAVPVQVNPPEG